MTNRIDATNCTHEAALERIAELEAKLEGAENRAERYEEALYRIAEWSKAYPLDIFLEPDLKRAHEVLKAAGMGIDGISAEAMRHALKGVGRIATDALPDELTAQIDPGAPK
jgi:hypothetical protein